MPPDSRTGFVFVQELGGSLPAASRTLQSPHSINVTLVLELLSLMLAVQHLKPGDISFGFRDRSETNNELIQLIMIASLTVVLGTFPPSGHIQALMRNWKKCPSENNFENLHIVFPSKRKKICQ